MTKKPLCSHIYKEGKNLMCGRGAYKREYHMLEEDPENATCTMCLTNAINHLMKGAYDPRGAPKYLVIDQVVALRYRLRRIQGEP